MTDRACIRGCQTTDGPTDAYQGALICERCIRRLRRTLEDSADLCGHIRTLIDPRKAAVYDQEKLNAGKAVMAPAPMNVDLIDAGNHVITALTYWASYFGDTEDYRWLGNGFPSTITPEKSYDVAAVPEGFLLEHLPEIANDSFVRLMAKAFIDFPEDAEEWTVQKALVRFPMDERGRFVKEPCPECGLRAVWMKPPRRFGQYAQYDCRKCEWQPPILERAIWAVYFGGQVVAA